VPLHKIRYGILYNAPIADLNLSIACKTAKFVIEIVKSKRADNQIFLLDRGLIDRCIFTDTLLRHQLIDPVSAQITKGLLTLPQLLDSIDEVFVFVTSPEIALEREYRNKLVRKDGEVMNPGFLATMRSIMEDNYKNKPDLVRNHSLKVIYTDQDDRHWLETAESVIEDILKIINNKGS